MPLPIIKRSYTSSLLSGIEFFNTKEKIYIEENTEVEKESAKTLEDPAEEYTRSSISILDGITVAPIEDIQRSLPSSVVDTQPPQSSNVQHLVETTSDSSFFDGSITMPIEDIQRSLPSSVDRSQPPLSCYIPCHDQEKYLHTVVEPSIGSSDPESPASLSSLSDGFSYSGINLPHQCISEPAVEEQVGKVISIGPDLSTIKKVRNLKSFNYRLVSCNHDLTTAHFCQQSRIENLFHDMKKTLREGMLIKACNVKTFNHLGIFIMY